MKHPNAVAGVVSTGLGGQIVLEVTSWFGWTISSGLAIWIAALITGAVLFVGRNGVAGVWNFVKHGSGGQQGAGEVTMLVLGVVLLGVILLVLKAY